MPFASLMLKLSPLRERTFSFRTRVSGRAARNWGNTPMGWGAGAREAMVGGVMFIVVVVVNVFIAKGRLGMRVGLEGWGLVLHC